MLTFEQLSSKEGKRTPETQRRYDSYLRNLETLETTPEDAIETLYLQGRNHVMIRNLFPYDVPRGVNHYVLWLRKGFNPSNLDHIIQDYRDRLGFSKAMYFKSSIPSIPGLRHVHVFFRNV